VDIAEKAYGHPGLTPSRELNKATCTLQGLRISSGVCHLGRPGFLFGHIQQPGKLQAVTWSSEMFCEAGNLGAFPARRDIIEEARICAP